MARLTDQIVVTACECSLDESLDEQMLMFWQLLRSG